MISTLKEIRGDGKRERPRLVWLDWKGISEERTFEEIESVRKEPVMRGFRERALRQWNDCFDAGKNLGFQN